MKFKLIFILIIFSISTPALPSSQTGMIKEISVRDDGLHWIYLNGNSRTEKPSCAENHDYFIIKDENSVYGKSQLSILLSAQLANKEITIIGSGQCTRWGDGEDIKSITLKG